MIAAMRPPTAAGSSVLSWQEAVLPRLSEAEAASWRHGRGEVVIEHRGRFWSRVVPGFYQPIHLLAKLSAREATRPTAACWGFRARVRPEEAADAPFNATMPVHLLPDPGGYGLERLPGTRRQRLRRGLAEVEIVALREPDLLLDQGFAVALEAKTLSPGLDLGDSEGFRRWALSFFPRCGLILAGLQHGRLLGFCSTLAVDRAAYQDVIYVGEEGRRLQLTLSLFHSSAVIAGRCPGVREVMNGLHLRESPGLCDFKRTLGLEVTHLPARAWMAPLVERGLRRFRPNAAYRLTGRG